MLGASNKSPEGMFCTGKKFGCIYRKLFTSEVNNYLKMLISDHIFNHESSLYIQDEFHV